jgi:hypothetical protein
MTLQCRNAPDSPDETSPLEFRQSEAKRVSYVPHFPGTMEHIE